MTKGFAQIPNEVLTDNRLSALEKVVYSLILGKSNQQGYCWASNETLGEWSGCSIRHIQRSLSALKKLDYIKTEQKTENGKTKRKIFPQVKVEKQDDMYDTPRMTRMSSNNTLSLKRKRADKKFDNFYPQWIPLSYTGTETLKEDPIFRATNGLYDSTTLKQECKFRWPQVSPDKTELYQQVIKKINDKVRN
jgi:hypothetical protein